MLLMVVVVLGVVDVVVVRGVVVGWLCKPFYSILLQFVFLYFEFCI